MRKSLCVFVAAWVLVIAASSSSATTIVLDSLNNWSAQIEPGAGLNRPSIDGFGPIIGVGVQFAIGTSDLAVFPGTTSIGDGIRLDGNRPLELVNSNLAFTIKVLSNGHLYDAFLTYFRSPGDGDEIALGTPPEPFNDATAVFELQQVPEPSSLTLFAFGALGLFRIARRRRI